MNSSGEALELAVRLVGECGRYAEQQQAGVTETLKSTTARLSGAVVTAVDVEVERRVDTALAERFPDDALVGEEFADRPGTTGRTWYVDPVDGTLNYARRLGPWSVVVSAFSAGRCDLVAVYTQGVVYSALRGGGAWLDGVPLRIDPAAPVAGGIVRAPSLLAAATFEAGWLPRSVDSSATELCQVADGRAVGAVRLGGHPRDLHGPALLVQEAGGTVTDLRGGQWSASSLGLVLATPAAHPALLALGASLERAVSAVDGPPALGQRGLQQLPGGGQHGQLGEPDGLPR